MFGFHENVVDFSSQGRSYIYETIETHALGTNLLISIQHLISPMLVFILSSYQRQHHAMLHIYKATSFPDCKGSVQKV